MAEAEEFNFSACESPVSDDEVGIFVWFLGFILIVFPSEVYKKIEFRYNYVFKAVILASLY